MKNVMVASQNVAEAVNLPWEMILEFVMEMLASCFDDDNQLVEYAKNVKSDEDVGVFKRVVATIMVRRYFGVRRNRAVEIRDEMFRTMSAMNDEDLKTVHKEVMDEMVPVRFLI